MLYKQSDAKKVTIQLKIKSEVVSLCTSGKFHVTMFQFLARIFLLHILSCYSIHFSFFWQVRVNLVWVIIYQEHCFFLINKTFF